MAGYITAGQQIVEIANSAYPYSVPYQTMQQLQFESALENMGYTIAKDGQAYYTGHIAAAAAESSPVVGNTLVETKIVTDAGTGTQTLTTSVPQATTTTGGTSLLKGALFADVSPVAAGMAICTALGYELDSIHDYPEFWTDFSDAMIGDTKEEQLSKLVAEPLDWKNGFNVIMRAKDAGGIASYCEEKKIRQAVDYLYSIGAFQTSADLRPEIEHGGTYDIHAYGCDFDEALNSFNVPKPAASVYEAAKAQFNSNTGSCNAMVVGCHVSLWSGGGYVRFEIDCYNIPDSSTMTVNYNNGTITTTAQLPGYVGTYILEYDYYTGQHRQTEWRSTPRGNDNYLNYSTSGYTVKSTINSEYIVPPDSGLTPDPNATRLTDPSQFDTLFASWLANAFETDRVNPETQENEKVRWLPLKLWDYINDPSVGPNNQTAVQDGTLPAPTGLPDNLPQYIIDYLIPNITFPNFQFPETPTGDTPVVVNPSNSLSNKLYTVYNPSDANLNSLGAYLWDASIVRQLVELFTNNPMDAIISLHQIYATPTTGAAQHIILGCLDSGVSADVVTDQYVTIDCGTVNVPELYGDARDYTGVQCEIVLPFIGLRTLDCHDVICCSVNVVYHIDVYTGSTLAEIRVSKQGVTQTLYTFEGNCSIQIPLTAADRSRMVQGIVAATTGLITGGVGAMAGAAAASALGGAAQTSIQKSSGFSGNAGAMGCKTPYIVVTRQKSADAVNYQHMIGNPTNKQVRLIDCRGFTKVSSVHVDIPRATDQEKLLIEQRLKEGIVI